MHIVELVGSILQTVIISVTRSTVIHLCLEYPLQRTGIFKSRCTCREHYTFTFLDIHLKIAGNIEILIEVISTFLLLRILNASIPVRLEVKLILLVKLHVQFGIARIHARLDTVLNLLIVTIRLIILMRIFTHAAKRQERTETQCGGRVCIYQRITQQHTVFVVYEYNFLTQNDTTHSEGRSRNFITFKLTDVLMSIRAEVIAIILMQSQIELSTMLNHRFIE